MKNQIKPLIYLLLASIIILPNVSCESGSLSDVNQDKVFMNYRFNYNASTGKTTALATYRFNGATGTALELDPPSSSTVNGLEMDEKSFPNVYYEREFAGAEPEGKFKFVDADETVYENNIELAKSIDLSVPDNTISKNAAFVLTWIGEPVKAFETVSLSLSSSTNLYFGSIDDVGATSITIPLSELSQFESGTYSISVERTYEPPLEEFTVVGGRISSDYKSVDRSVSVL